MSETTDRKPSQEELAKQKAEAIAAVKSKLDAELKVFVDKYTALEGKTFIKNSDVKKQIVKMVKYIGVHTIHAGVRAHLIEVEIKGVAAWHPVASKFLEEYTEVKTTETENSKII